MIRSFLVVMRQKFLAPHLLVGALILGGTGCGGGSGAPTHTTNPVPQIASLSPNSTAAGEAAFTLIVTGTGFISGSVVRWNRADRTTTFVSSSQLTATISANDIAVSGTFQVTVFNPSPGGGTSNALTFTINNPAPTLSLIAPNSAFAGGADFTLTATGSQFVSSSVVHWNGSNRATTFVTSTELQAAILASDIAAVGTAQVTVFNPAPGGGISAPQAFTISLASPTPGVIERVSVANDGTEGNFDSFDSVISADGRFVAFDSRASNLAAGDTNGSRDVFLRDTCVGAPAGCTPSTTRVSVASDGSEGNGISDTPSISADGRFVAFAADASNLVAGDTNGAGDVFVRDTCVGVPAGCTPSTTRVSVASDGTQGNAGVFFDLSISADGRFVAFDSNASNLVADDTNGFIDVFLARTGFAAAPATTGAPLPAGTVLTPTEPTSEAFSRLAPFLWSLLLLALVGQLTRGGDGTYRGQFTWPTRAKPISLPLVKLFSLYRTGPGVLEVLTYTRANAQKQRGHEGPLTLGDIPTHQLAKRLVRTRCGSRLH